VLPAAPSHLVVHAVYTPAGGDEKDMRTEAQLYRKKGRKK